MQLLTSVLGRVLPHLSEGFNWYCDNMQDTECPEPKYHSIIKYLRYMSNKRGKRFLICLYDKY